MGHEAIQGQVRQTRAKLEERFATFEQSLLQEISFLTGSKISGRAAPPPPEAAPAREDFPAADASEAQEELKSLAQKTKHLQDQNRILAGTVGRLNKDLEIQEKRNRELQSVVQKLREEVPSAQAAPLQVQPEAPVQSMNDSQSSEVLKQLEELQDRLKKAESSTADYLNEIETKNGQLKEQLDLLAAIRSRREQEKGERESVQAEMEKARAENEALRMKLAARLDKSRRAARFWRRWVAAYRSQKRFLLGKKWG